MPRKTSIRRKLTGTFVIIIFLTVLIFELLFTYGMHVYYYSNIEQTLLDRIRVTIEVYDRYLGYESLASKAKFILENTSVPEYVDAQVLDLKGYVLESTARIPSSGPVVTPDFHGAVVGQTSVWRGKNPETQEWIMAVSSPLFERDERVGVIRYMTSVEAVVRTIRAYLLYAYLIGVVVLLIVLKLSTLLGKHIVEPLYELKTVADSIAAGNFKVRAHKHSEDELGELADTLNYMIDEIQKTEQLKHDFISSISHELRTPLTSIKGWSETILTGDMENYMETQMGLEIISKETDRLHGLVENLLDFSKLEGERMPMRFEPFNLVELMERVIKQFSALLRTHKISCHLSAANGYVLINGDRNRIKQVLINILDNAVKHTPNSGNILCQITALEDKVMLTIRDNGVGIAKEHLERITERFYKANPKQGGSGLGLAIAKGIIERHSGKLVIESALGKGTAITIILPIEQEGDA
jgi:signal transduction histidine kinase